MIEKDLFMKYMTTILVSSMSAGFDPEHWQFLQIFETPTEYVAWYSENNKDEGLFTRFCDWIENDEYVQPGDIYFSVMQNVVASSFIVPASIFEMSMRSLTRLDKRVASSIMI